MTSRVSVDARVVRNKDHERLEQVGLTLAQAKALRVEVPRQVRTRPIAAFLAARRPCPSCGRSRGPKDHQTIVCRTVFGRLSRRVCAPARAPREPITVGIDGGSLRHWPQQQAHFLAIVGEAGPRDGRTTRFGVVQRHDGRPRHHVAEVLRSQGPAA